MLGYRYAPDIPDCCLCKDIGLYRVPLRQPNDLCRAGCKVKSDLSPFAVVVHLLQVDSGGNCFIRFPNFYLTQRNRVSVNSNGNLR